MSLRQHAGEDLLVSRAGIQPAPHGLFWSTYEGNQAKGLLQVQGLTGPMGWLAAIQLMPSWLISMLISRLMMIMWDCLPVCGLAPVTPLSPEGRARLPFGGAYSRARCATVRPP